MLINSMTTHVWLLMIISHNLPDYTMICIKINRSIFLSFIKLHYMIKEKKRKHLKYVIFPKIKSCIFSVIESNFVQVVLFSIFSKSKAKSIHKMNSAFRISWRRLNIAQSRLLPQPIKLQKPLGFHLLYKCLATCMYLNVYP